MITWLVARVIAIALPWYFQAGNATDLEAVLEVRVRGFGGRRAMPVTVEIADGACRARPAAAPQAGAVATLGLEDMIRLALGLTGWPALMSAGRLELSGDPFLALRFPSLFRLPVQ